MTELQRKAGRGLLMAMNEVGHDHLAEFTQWYETEHLLDRQKFPGIITARRYVNREGGPREFLARYDLDSLSVLETPEYKAILTTPWTEWIKKYFLRPSIRRLGTELGPESAARNAKNLTRTDTQGLVLISVDAKPASEKEFRGWVETVHLPKAQACKGVLSARFFKDVGGKENSFTLLYDLETDEVARSAQFKALPAIDAAFCASPPQQFLYKEINPGVA